MRYTSESLKEYFSARQALEAVPPLTDWTKQRDRLDRAEQALIDQGWRNLENEQELREMLQARERGFED